MTTMKLFSAVILGSMMVFAAGCGKSKALTVTEEYEKAACACKDLACATAATKAYGDNAKEMASASSGEAEAITKAASHAAECVTKVSMAGIPGMPGAK